MKRLLKERELQVSNLKQENINFGLRVDETESLKFKNEEYIKSLGLKETIIDKLREEIDVYVKEA